MSEIPIESVAVELDAMHAEALAIVDRRDLAAYRELFLPELHYRRVDGRVAGRDDLVREFVRQIRKFRWTRSEIVRESLDVEEGRATEVLTRTHRVGVSAFLVVHRTFRYVIRGRYTWRKADGLWRVERIEVLEQRVAPGRFTFGFRSRPEGST